MGGIWQTLKQLFGLEAPPPSEPSRPAAPPPGPAQPNATERLAAQFAAEAQASAKKRDDAHKAELRAHAERTPPSKAPDDLATVATARGACLAVRHVFPPCHPQRSMSFLGGTPLGPDSLEPPMVHNRRGLLQPLTFMAQIDVGALPDGPGRSLLPKDGYLYFFAPMSDAFDRIAGHHVVRYVPGKVKKNWGPMSLSFAEPLEGVEQARHRFPWMNWRPESKRFYPTTYPRVEIELGWLEIVGEVEEGDPDAENGFPWEVAAQRQRAALVAFHGEPVAWDPVLSRRGKPVDSLWTPFEGFPTNHRAGEILAGFVRTWQKEEKDALQARLEALPTSDPPDAERSRLEALRAAHDHFARVHYAALNLAMGATNRAQPLTAEQRQQVLALLEDLRAGRCPAPFVERTYGLHRLPLVLDTWISVAAIESVETALADKDGAAEVPPHIVEAIRHRHAVLKVSSFAERGEYRQHQMFGRGDVVQVAADDFGGDYVLLLQLGPDEALGWTMGDMGVAQYWIHPADLRERRFDKAFLTFESH